MHPHESNLGVPAFLAKLWRLVEDSETNNLISWSTDGRSFIIQNQAKFAKELLPLNYKHNNMASFIRQLNMYGFHKITSIDNGGLKFDKDEMEFSHPYFQKGHAYLLEHIKRKIANPKAAEVEKAAPKSETVNRVLTEVKNMRGRQESLDSRFSSMKQENEALWREVAILRQKHMKQQQIVNKLIQFLVTIVQPQRSGLGSGIGKRRGQLMINDAPQSKLRKANTGPIISELTEELLDDVDSDLDENLANITNVQSPGSQSSKDVDGTSTSAGSADGFSLDDDDIVDTNSIAIYKSAADKKNRRSGAGSLRATVKKEPVEVETVVKPESHRKPPSAGNSGKSLLMPSKNSAVNVHDMIDEDDLIMNVLEEEAASGSSLLAGPSMNLNSNQIAVQNTMFDETSQPPANLLEGDLFDFDDKKADETTEDLIVTKYNPKHANDIMRLSSVNEYSSHLENVQNDLDSLKDLLSNESYQLDANQLLGAASLPIYMSQSSFDTDTLNKLFGNEDLIGYELSPNNMDLFACDDKKNNQGASSTRSSSELMTYQPSPYNNNLDLSELLQNVGDVEAISTD